MTPTDPDRPLVMVVFYVAAAIVIIAICAAVNYFSTP
jgi:hypothetical protein